MFCKKCGQENGEGSAYCAKCGTKMDVAPVAAVEQETVNQVAEPVVASTVQQTTEKAAEPSVAEKVTPICNSAIAKAKELFAYLMADKKRMGIAAGALVVVIVVICVLANSGSTPKKEALKLLDAISDEETDEYLDKLSDDAREVMADIACNGDEDMLYDQMEYASESFIDMLEDSCGRDVKVSFKVESVDELRESKEESFIDDMDDYYNVDVEDVREVSIVYTAKGKDDDDEDDMEMYVIKVDGEWIPMLGY